MFPRASSPQGCADAHGTNLRGAILVVVITLAALMYPNSVHILLFFKTVPLHNVWTSLITRLVKNLPAMWENWV